MSPAADALFEALRQAEGLRGETAAIKSANDPPRTLEELQARARLPSEPGYEKHHIVGQFAQNRLQFGDDLIYNRENEVRIPVVKHMDISRFIQPPTETTITCPLEITSGAKAGRADERGAENPAAIWSPRVMVPIQSNDRRIQDIVARFVEVGLEQHEILYSLGSTSRYNRLFAEMQRITTELQEMPGDQRRALLPLLSHSNAQVRLQASHSLLALFPATARKCLEDIRDSGISPVYAYAASALRRLDEESYIPS